MFLTGLDFILNARTFAFGGERPATRSSAIAVGRRIVDRQVVGGESPDSPFRAGEVVYAESAVAGQSEFHFVANVTVGDKTFSAEDNKGPTYSQADVEQMLASFKTLAAKK